MPLPPAVPFYSAQDLRAMGLSETEIAEKMIQQGFPVDPPMGIAPEYDNSYGGNIPFNPEEVTPAITGLGPQEPSEEYKRQLANNFQEQPVRPVQQETPIIESQPSVVQEQAAMNRDVGGPGYPVEQRQISDPYGSYFAGMASAQQQPYSGGLQQIAAMLGNGAMSWQKQMAADRNSMGATSTMKDYNFAKSEGYDGSFIDFKDQFGGNAILKAMAAQQGIALKAEQTSYDRSQDIAKRQEAAEKELYKRSSGSIPAGFESHEIEDNAGNKTEVLRPRVGTEKYEASIDGGNAINRAMNDVSRLRSLLKEHGSEAWGTYSGEMTSIHKKILQNLAKAWQMGALSKDELFSITDSLPNPGAIQGTMTSNDKMDAQLGIYEQDFRDKLGDSSKQMSRWGYKDPWASEEVIKLPPRRR